MLSGVYVHMRAGQKADVEEGASPCRSTKDMNVQVQLRNAKIPFCFQVLVTVFVQRCVRVRASEKRNFTLLKILVFTFCPSGSQGYLFFTL